MIYISSKVQSNPNRFHSRINDAIEFLRKTDFSNHHVGQYEIEGKDIFYQVHDTKTDLIDNRRPEVHRKYIDVQFLYKGKERIGFALDHGDNEVREDLLEVRDILFYKSVANESILNMYEGDIAVFFPEDIHRPSCERDGVSEIRKVVYKINISLLED